MPFTTLPWTSRWAVLFFATLSACGEPKKPVATSVVAPVMTKELLVSALSLADSIAASYGLAAGFGADAMELPDQWLARWPVGKGWIPLMPGRLPGLRAWLTTDSLQAYTHGEEPQDYSFHLRYPAFAGPRADSLRRTVGRFSDLPEELAAVRRQRLYSAPAPRTPTGDEESEVLSDCRREETNTLDCYSLGAYVMGADTVVSAAGTTYFIGHCVHGGAGRVTATYSLRQQRLLEFDDLFRPALRRALYHTVAGYVLWHQQKNWRANRRADRLPLMAQTLDWQWRQWLEEVAQQERERQTAYQLRRPHRPFGEYPTFSGDSFSSEQLETSFYFGPTGVVFFIGYDLGVWQLLVPYASLLPYLCGPNDPSG